MKESNVTTGFGTTDICSLNKKSMINLVLASIFCKVSEMGEVVGTIIRSQELCTVNLKSLCHFS